MSLISSREDLCLFLSVTLEYLLIWNPLHCILLSFVFFFFFLIIQVTQITNQSEDWFVVADSQGSFFIFYSLPWSKTGKQSLLFFHPPCGIFVAPALRGYLLLESLPWPSSKPYLLFLTCVSHQR